MFDRTPVTQAVARRLQDMIRNGELKKDEKLPSQRILSERLNVSRASLREALLTLETLGLVRTFPARGTFVLGPERRPDASRPTWRYGAAYAIGDVFNSRVLLETELARLSARVMSDARLADLEQAARQFEEGWRAGDLVAHVEADLDFHRTIAEGCPNPLLVSLYNSVQDLLTESQRQPIPNTETERMEASIAEHGAILEALAERSPERAAEAMKAHILNTARCAGVRLE